jgi:Spy/CpxP family protein refolding chaperone
MEMRNVLVGTIAGLILGSIGALAYSHYLGDGKLVDDLQAQLDAANADLANAKKDKQQMSSETSGVSEQIDQLSASNADLRKQLDDAKNAPATATATPAINPSTLMGMMMGMMRGGGGPFQAQQRLFVMQKRLNLTPDQAAKIKAAMDADNKARRDLMRQRFQNNGQVDPAAAAAANTLDKTLATVLSPDQQMAYQQLQADEKASRAEISATSQVDGVMPLLQLSDSQKEAAMDALYQVQMAAPDQTTLLTSPNPMAAITAQAQSTEAALAKVLTPAQLTIYQQQAQAQAQAMAAFRGGRGGNGGGGNGGGNNAPAAANGSTGTSSTGTVGNYTTTTPPAVNADGTTATSTTQLHNADGTVTTVGTTTGYVSTNAPAASAPSTNAAPTQ